MAELMPTLATSSTLAKDSAPENLLIATPSDDRSFVSVPSGADCTTPAPAQGMAPAAGDVPHIASTEITVCSLIGRGGFGSVFLGRWLEMAVAVKVTNVADRVHTVEAQLLQKLRHPCICTFFGTTLIDGRLAMVMEYLQGGSLAALLRNGRNSGGGLDAAMICRISSEVAAGLAFLHRNGIIHRDVKAENVLLDAVKHAKVADFGISKACNESSWGACPPGDEVATSDPHSPEQHTMGVGTPRYAAPEVFASCLTHTRYDERVDVYSFGLLLWEMSHSQKAFDGLPGHEAAKHAWKGLRPTISLAGSSGMEGFAELIAACWHHEPSERMSMLACAEQLAALHRVQSPASTSASDASSRWSSSCTNSTPAIGGGDDDSHHTAKLSCQSQMFVPPSGTAAVMTSPAQETSRLLRPR